MNKQSIAAYLRLGIAGAVALALGTGIANAQSAPSLSSADAAFLTSTGQGSVYEQTLSQLGMERGSTATIRQYAQALALDHGTFNVDLMGLANKFAVVVPVMMNVDDQKHLASMIAQSNATFDSAFLTEEARINAQDISDETKALSTTHNADMKTFVMNTLDGDRFHLMLTQHLMKGM